MNIDSFIFLSLFVLAPIWVLVNYLVIKQLKLNHAEFYTVLGSPTLFLPKKFIGAFAMSKLLLNGHLLKSNDKKLNKLGYIATILLIYFTFSLVYIVWSVSIKAI